MGLLIVAAARFRLAMGMLLVGIFAIYHGYAHGAEMPEMATGLYYGLGFALATTILHLTGIFLGVGFLKLSETSIFARFPILRASGIAVVLGGLVVLLNG